MYAKEIETEKEKKFKRTTKADNSWFDDTEQVFFF